MQAKRIYRRHLTALKYCARGSRAFFEKHGFEWSDFLRNGIEREILESTHDAMATKAIAIADAEMKRGNR